MAVLNGGFESDEPCVLLPVQAALRILPGPPWGAKALRAEVAGGETSFLLADESLDATVVTPDREGPRVECQILISGQDREVLISDSGIDALGVEVQAFRKGLWRFRGETASRPSEAPQHW
ncbi:MAG: hypothetical protein HY720_16855 [Planctomycetes bacterium]|nr:hypothetical protein [Planctomycetota bacterium]